MKGFDSKQARKEAVDKLLAKLHERGLMPDAVKADVEKTVDEAYEIGRQDQRLGRYI